MKNLNIPLENKEFKALACSKRDYEADTEKRCSWAKFLLILLKSYEGKK